MAEDRDPQIVRKMPAFPGVDATRNPFQYPPGARSMMGLGTHGRVDVPAPTIDTSGKRPGDKKREARE